MKKKIHIRSVKDLLIYSYRVAGTVGLMMSKILKVKDKEALKGAVDLGIAMQLTNIARDVCEVSLFMFVLLCNMVGMLPYAFTVTSHIIVTLIMALFIFIAVTIIGFFKHGFKYLNIFIIFGRKYSGYSFNNSFK